MHRFILTVVLTGVGATLLMDAWGLLLRKAFGIRSLDLCLLGRWVLHMPQGRFVHASIAAAEPRKHECAVGWVLHYAIGTSLALAFAVIVSPAWFAQPTPGPALRFGIVTVLIPWLTLQPAFGLGIASSKTPRPGMARLRSLATHTVFGAGLYLMAHLATSY